MADGVSFVSSSCNHKMADQPSSEGGKKALDDNPLQTLPGVGSRPYHTVRPGPARSARRAKRGMPEHTCSASSCSPPTFRRLCPAPVCSRVRPATTYPTKARWRVPGGSIPSTPGTRRGSTCGALTHGRKASRPVVLHLLVRGGRVRGVLGPEAGRSVMSGRRMRWWARIDCSATVILHPDLGINEGISRAELCYYVLLDKVDGGVADCRALACSGTRSLTYLHKPPGTGWQRGKGATRAWQRK